jgi:hypothetical protein
LRLVRFNDLEVLWEVDTDVSGKNSKAEIGIGCGCSHTNVVATAGCHQAGQTEQEHKEAASNNSRSVCQVQGGKMRLMAHSSSQR